MCQVPPSGETAFYRLAEQQAREMTQQWKTKIFGKGFFTWNVKQRSLEKDFSRLSKGLLDKKELIRVTVSTSEFKSAASIHLLDCLDAKLN